MTTRGYTLIECLVSVALIGLLSAFVARSTQQLSSQLAETTYQIEQQLAISKSSTVIASVLRSLERSRQSELLAISNGSDLRAPHGGPHPLVGIGATSKPRTNSGVLSVIEVDPMYQARIVDSKVTSNGVGITVCGTPSVPSAERFKSHIILGPGGLCQVTGEPQASSSGCFTLSGTATRGLVHSLSTCPGGSFHEYIPVSRELSLFIDNSGIFRLASHVGMRIIENQPITRGLRELSIRWMPTNLETNFVHVGIRTSASFEHRFLFPSALRKALIWNEILL